MDIRQSITNSIIEMIEAGIKLEKRTLWDGDNARTRQVNFKTGKPYSGINVLVLWLASMQRNQPSAQWLTYNQALELGGQVKKGAKGVLCAYWQQMASGDDGANGEGQGGEDGGSKKRASLMMKPFWLFNVNDVDGVAIKPEAWAERPEFEAIEDAERIIQASGVEIIEGGNGAFYRTRSDRVNMPDRQRFERSVDFYHVALHELTHATGHESRLNRQACGKFGTAEYAFEELVAELGSAFVLAHIGLVGSTMPEHANYLQGWLSVLKSDKDAIFRASRQANQAYQYLIERAGMGCVNQQATH